MECGRQRELQRQTDFAIDRHIGPIKPEDVPGILAKLEEVR